MINLKSVLTGTEPGNSGNCFHLPVLKITFYFGHIYVLHETFSIARSPVKRRKLHIELVTLYFEHICTDSFIRSPPTLLCANVS